MAAPTAKPRLAFATCAFCRRPFLALAGQSECSAACAAGVRQGADASAALRAHLRERMGAGARLSVREKLALAQEHRMSVSAVVELAAEERRNVRLAQFAAAQPASPVADLTASERSAAGARVRRWRAAKGLSQEALAAAACVQRRTLGEMEHGCILAAAAYDAVAAALGCTARELLETEPPSPQPLIEPFVARVPRGPHLPCGGCGCGRRGVHVWECERCGRLRCARCGCRHDFCA